LIRARTGRSEKRGAPWAERDFAAHEWRTRDYSITCGAAWQEPLEDSGVIANCALTCTKHLWSWDLSSLDLLGETERPLQSYDVKLENGDILALIDKELVYEFEDEDNIKDDDFFSKA